MSDRKGIFLLPPMESVHHGAGSIRALAEVLDAQGCRNALLITGNTLNTKTDLVGRVLAASEGRIRSVFSSSVPHVPRATVLEAATVARKMKADCIISFGGGSPNDTAKSVVLALSEGISDLSDFDKLRVVYKSRDSVQIPSMKGEPVPLIAIPTTLSAGDFTWFSGITDERRLVKDLYIDRKLAAKSVILDAELTLATPTWLWLSTGMRSVDHCIEALCSTTAHPFTDATCGHALRILDEGLRLTKANPDDLGIRTELQIASWLSIFGLANVSLGLSHGIGHQLGARCNVPHGYTSLVMLHNVLRFNLEHTHSQQRGITALMTQNGRNPASAADAVLQLVQDLGQPWRLRDVGVKQSDFADIAKDALEDIIVSSNPRPTSRDEVISLLSDSY